MKRKIEWRVELAYGLSALLLIAAAGCLADLVTGAAW